jgi:hypothetical protein
MLPLRCARSHQAVTIELRDFETIVTEAAKAFASDSQPARHLVGMQGDRQHCVERGRPVVVLPLRGRSSWSELPAAIAIVGHQSGEMVGLICEARWSAGCDAVAQGVQEGLGLRAVQ